MTPASHTVTQLLIRWSEGDDTALDRLIPYVERELHRIAREYMRRENPRPTFQTSAVVNEVYLKLVDQTRVQWENRAHFFAVAAQLMRRILMDHARLPESESTTPSVLSNDEASELISLDKAIDKLAKIDKRKAQVVELRYFGGLSVAETAEVLNLPSATVMRDWNFAKSWLRHEIRQGT